MRRGFLFLAILLANTISAATQFKFVIESTGDPLNPRRAGTVRIEGLSYRVDGEGENLVGSASFSTDGGKTVTTLNEKLSTYYQPKALPGRERQAGITRCRSSRWTRSPKSRSRT